MGISQKGTVWAGQPGRRVEIELRWEIYTLQLWISEPLGEISPHPPHRPWNLEIEEGKAPRHFRGVERLSGEGQTRPQPQSDMRMAKLCCLEMVPL